MINKPFINKLVFIRSRDFYPYRNQAVEAELTGYAAKGCLIIYLWANDKTVFIGKNQNAFSECNIELLEKDGGFLCRRFTGGGAVYHDKGNINFTFISHKEEYDKRLNFEIMLEAVKSLGLNAELSGRNDITVDGKKFSGNAFYEGREVGLHHGTVLINTDQEKLQKYLKVSSQKLVAKGVKSVVSRVVNLGELNTSITADSVAKAIFDAARAKYPEADVEEWNMNSFDENRIKDKIEGFTDRSYLLGEDVIYDTRLEKRFDWGTADIRVKARDGKIEKIKIYSDSLDTELASRQEKALIGAKIDSYSGEFSDITEALSEKLRLT